MSHLNLFFSKEDITLCVSYSLFICLTWYILCTTFITERNQNPTQLKMNSSLRPHTQKQRGLQGVNKRNIHPSKQVDLSFCIWCLCPPQPVIPSLTTFSIQEYAACCTCSIAMGLLCVHWMESQTVSQTTFTQLGTCHLGMVSETRIMLLIFTGVSQSLK